jgi:hypothetical protein
MHKIAALFLALIVNSCTAAVTHQPDASPPPDNVVRCQCNLQILDVFSYGWCVLAGGTSHDGYCWVSKVEDACFASGGDAGTPEQFCASQAANVLSVLHLNSGYCPAGHICPQLFCSSTIISCTALLTYSYPTCDRPCPHIPLALTPDGHIANFSIAADSATFVPADLSCSGADTPPLCTVDRE